MVELFIGPKKKKKKKKEFPKKEKKKIFSSLFPGHLNKMRITWLKENDI